MSTVRANQIDPNTSARVSIPTLGYTSPSGSTLSAYTKLTERVSVIDFGATGDGVTDDSNAISLAIDYCLTNKNALYFPAGDYLISTAVVKNVAGPKLMIYGDGMENSRVLVSNSTGGIHIVSSNRNGEVYVRDIAFVAQIKGSGVGFKSTAPAGGNQHNKMAVLNRVKFTVANINDAVNYAYFNTACDLEGNWYPTCENVVIAGPYGPGITSDLTDASPLYDTGVGLNLDNCYGPEVRRCHIWSAATAIQCRSSTGGNEAEAFYLLDTELVNVRNGLLWQRTGQEPTIWIDNVHTNYRDTGFRIDGARLVWIKGCAPYNEDTGQEFATPTDIALDNAQLVQIHNNIFHFNGNPDRVCISLDATTQMQKVMIANNQFNCLADRAITVGASATQVQILFNEYPGTITTNVQDLSNNATIIGRGGIGIFEIESQDDAGTILPWVSMYRKSASPAAADQLGFIPFHGDNSAGQKVQYAGVRATIDDPTDTIEAGGLQLFASMEGSLQIGVSLDDGTATNNNTAMLVRVNKAGSVSLDRVSVGATDTGGAGFRVLRVPN